MQDRALFKTLLLCASLGLLASPLQAQEVGSGIVKRYEQGGAFGGIPEDPAGAAAANGEMVLHFRTNSSDVEAHYRAQLRSFVDYVKSVPDAVIEMSGHADRRDEQSGNLALSQRRLREVEKALRELGAGSVVFETTALGSQQPVSQADTPESNSFDRRVVLSVRSGTGELLSSTR